MSDENLNATPCTAIVKKTGLPCRSFAVADGTTCRLHSLSPEQRKENARRGAAATNEAVIKRKALAKAKEVETAIAVLQPGALAGPVEINTPEQFEQTLVRAITATMDGSLPPSRAKAVASLLKLKLDAAQLAISKTLVELERRLNQQQPGRRI